MTIQAQYRLLNTLRNNQYQHLALQLSPELFTDNRKSILEAYQIAMRKYGVLTVDGIENAYGESLPAELDIPLSVDPMPIIDELRRHAKKRIVRELAQELGKASNEHDPDVREIRRQLENLDTHIAHDPSIVPGISSFLGNMRAKASDQYRWLTTGVKPLDQLIGGEWPRGELSIVTGKSGGGKTALMGASSFAIAEKHAIDNSVTTPTIFSMEMPKDQLVTRWVSTITGIDSRALRFGKNLDGTPFNVEQETLINGAMQRLQKMPIAIFDVERMSANQIIAEGRRALQDYGSELFFVDYLQLMSYEGELGKHYGLGDAGKQLKQFAKRYNVAVVVLAQYHEAKETIRDSTDPEKDCALWVHLDIDFDGKDSHGICAAKFELKKNRHGPVGSTTVLLDTRRMLFITNNET